ncbi:butyrophilin subfamily 2 member A2-like, partial [Polyodon spathula]|uniref:butyrophilin subfamily 2 member A2-like n=1 Tax=Polyodon spathula TaxID=7913 RepID=UPI001B7F7431
MKSFSTECVVMIFLISSHIRDSKAAFKVIVPTSPVIGTAGEDSILPCQLSTSISAEDFEVRWYRERFDDLVYQYKGGKELTQQQSKEYQGRASLLNQQPGSGVLSLVLKKVRVSDEGKYTCFAGTSKWYEEPNMELQVQAFGSAPVIHIEEHLKRFITLSCLSLGWYPQPEMYWTDGAGRNVTALTQPSVQRDRNGLYSIRSHVQVKKNSNDRVSCLVIQKRQRREMKSSLQISEQFFESTNPGRFYISGFLIPAALALVCIMAACLYAFKRKQECDKTCVEFGNLKKAEKDASKKCEGLLQELHAVKTIPNSVWNLIQEAAENVILDPDTANKCLVLSDDGTSMTLGKENLALFDTKRRFERPFCVLGREGFTSKHYWELKVEKMTGWIAGVAKESAKRNGQVILFPEMGFWVIRLENEKFIANTVPNESITLPLSLKPQNLGVYLDYKERQLSFYNVETRSHIYTFTDMDLNPNEKVYPLVGTTPSCREELHMHHLTRLKTEKPKSPMSQAGEESAVAALAGEEDTNARYSKEDQPLLPDKKKGVTEEDSKKGALSKKKDAKERNQKEKKEKEKKE